MFANVTWPSLVFYHRERAWCLIVAAVLVEFLILRRSLKTTPARAIGIIVAINAFSAIAGSFLTLAAGDWRLPLLPWFGLQGTFGVNQAAFTLGAWGVTIPCAAMLSTMFEGVLLFSAFYRVTSRQSLFWLPMANLASAELTFLSLWLVPPW